jgi:metal-responsive CopG/Arc/MetJ family transcriptional regulator
MTDSRKKLISIRFDKEILESVDSINKRTRFHSRTDLIEEACAVYAAYIQDCLEREEK